MGSLYGWYTRKDVIRHLIKDDEPRLKTLAHCVRGNILWTVQHWEGREPFIGCYILKGPVKGNGDDPYACGYKDMSEEMHPYYYNCPVRYLDMAPEVCPEWREKVRAIAARKSTKLEVGDIATLSSSSVKVVQIDQLKPLRGFAVNEEFKDYLVLGYTRYRIPRSLLTGKVFKTFEEYRAAQKEAA